MKKVPLSGSLPDIFSAEPYKQEVCGNYLLKAFHDIGPMAASNGGAVIIAYPFVLAAIELATQDAVYFVTAETGLMFNTYFLCAFDGTGRHINFGPLDSKSGDVEFWQKALPIIVGALERDAKK